MVKITNNIPEGSRKFQKILAEQTAKALRESGNQILANSQKRFSSHFSGGKFAAVFSAIKESGILIKRSSDTKTTLFIANMDILDSKTALPPTKAEGNIHNFWRILHEGAGLLARAEDSNIFNVNKKTSPYPIQVIVQTSVLEPIFSPGKHPPFFELLNAEGIPGIIVLRHKGFKGHQWFLQNLDLFDADFKLLIRNLNKALQRTETLSQV